MTPALWKKRGGEEGLAGLGWGKAKESTKRKKWTRDIIFPPSLPKTKFLAEEEEKEKKGSPLSFWSCPLLSLSLSRLDAQKETEERGLLSCSIIWEGNKGTKFLCATLLAE